MIYLDNAATSLHKPKAVAEAMLDALNSFGGPGRSTHLPSLKASTALHSCRHRVKELFNATSAAQVCLGANATWALNTAVRGLYERAKESGAKLWLVSTAASHNSLLRPLYQISAAQTQAQLTLVPHRQDGSLDYELLALALREARQQMDSVDLLLLALNHASNVTGEVYELEQFNKLAQEYGALLLIDAAQSAGAVEIDVQAHGIDYLCFTGHKSLYGPQGTGGLVLSERAIIPRPLCVGGSGFNSQDHKHPSALPEALEAGTANAHSFAGLAAALQELDTKKIADISSDLQEKREYMWVELEKLSKLGLKLYGHRAGGHNGCIAFSTETVTSSQFADTLYIRYEICTRAGSLCAPLMLESLKAQSGLVRMSFSVHNSYEELDCAIKACREILR